MGLHRMICNELITTKIFKKTQTNDDMEQKSHVCERPKSKKVIICSFQNVLKIIFQKKLFMECLEEKEPLDRDEADGGSLTNDNERANSWMPAISRFLHQKWGSNGTNKHETRGRSQTAWVSVK